MISFWIQSILSIILFVFFFSCEKLLKQHLTETDRSSSSALLALVDRSHVYFADCGNSTAVLYRNGQDVLLSKQNKVVTRNVLKNNSDNGFRFLNSAPETCFIQRHADDEFLVLATDGIWNVMSPEDLYTFLEHEMSIKEKTSDVFQSLFQRCRELVRLLNEFHATLII